MKSSQNKKIILAGILLILGALGLRFALSALMTKHDAFVLATIDTSVTTQKKYLIAVADATRNNNGDDDINKVITDCKVNDRNRFDTLLDTLSKSITTNELTELNSLFDKCANFYALRKAVMTVHLNRAVTEYIELKRMRNQIHPYTSDIAVEFTTWQKIADSETKWSDYFSNLVTEQGLVIALFRNGKTATSPEVLKILEQVKNERAQLEVLGSEITQYRNSLSDI